MSSSVRLKLLLTFGCQWKELPIEKDAAGRRVIHHIRIWRTFRRWVSGWLFQCDLRGDGVDAASGGAAGTRVVMAPARRHDFARSQNAEMMRFRL